MYEEDDEIKVDMIIVPPKLGELTAEEDVNDVVCEVSVQDVPGTLEVRVEKDVSKECATYKDKPIKKKNVTLNQCGCIKNLILAKSRGVPSTERLDEMKEP